jgi:hypothetical protein
MKSFVYTVVAATIAASSAAANSTDASTSGTVPAVDQFDYCEFTDVEHGTMSYVPGFYMNQSNNGAGWWRTHQSDPATITVKTRGAAVVSVSGGDRVINRNDPSTVYPVKVDYAPSAVDYSKYGSEAVRQFGGWLEKSTAASVTIEPLPGVDMDDKDKYGPSWEDTGFRRVFTTKEDPNWDGNQSWGSPLWNSIKNPTAMTPEAPFTGSFADQPAYDQLNYHLRFTNYNNQPNLEYEFKLKIHGMAWMLGSDGKINYEDDGMGRTGEVWSSWNKAPTLSHYGMTDGDYYIEHTVQCLQ